MKLIPKAKAVRIRIKSGGEEHSSLDSLKRNFDLSDVRVLLDGRLSRWLKQQGKHDLATKIEASDKQLLSEDDFSLCKLFFETEINETVTDIYSFANYCFDNSNYRKTGINLLREIIYKDFKVAKNVYVTYGLNCFSGKEWISIFSKYEKLRDPEILFYLGRLYYDSVGDVYNGIKYINMAADISLQDAIEYKRKIDLNGIDKKKIKQWIEYNWDCKYKKQYLKFNEIFNDKEKNLVLFVCNSYQIAYRTRYYSVTNALEYFDIQYNNVDYIPEMTFIKAVLLKYIKSVRVYIDELNKIKDKCNLAKIELSSASHPFKEINSIPQKIEYIVKHFLDD